VNVAVSAVAIVPKSKSPLAVVVRFPLFGDEPLPVAIAVTSKEFAVARPEYSMMAKRSGPETVCEMVMVFAPPLTFSA
jgi:hypothetical protein